MAQRPTVRASLRAFIGRAFQPGPFPSGPNRLPIGDRIFVGMVWADSTNSTARYQIGSAFQPELKI